MLVVVILAGIVFYEIFVASKAVVDAKAMQATTTEAFAVTQSATLSDDEKGAAMRRSSVRMMSSVALIAGKIAIAVAAAGAFVFIASLVTWPFERLIAYSIQPLPLIATCVAVALYGMVRHGRRK